MVGRPHYCGGPTAPARIWRTSTVRGSRLLRTPPLRRRGETLDLRTLFLSWARRWRMNRPDRSPNPLLPPTRTLAPSKFRTNQVVRNFPEFYSAFGTAAGDRMLPLASGSNCRRAIRRPHDMKEPDTHTFVRFRPTFQR
ncbi:M13-type metalloendopeptidase [Nocardia gipuzkoensis]